MEASYNIRCFGRTIEPKLLVLVSACPTIPYEVLAHHAAISASLRKDALFHTSGFQVCFPNSHTLSSWCENNETYDRALIDRTLVLVIDDTSPFFKNLQKEGRCLLAWMRTKPQFDAVEDVRRMLWRIWVFFFAVAVLFRMIVWVTNFKY